MKVSVLWISTKWFNRNYEKECYYCLPWTSELHGNCSVSCSPDLQRQSDRQQLNSWILCANGPSLLIYIGYKFDREATTSIFPFRNGEAWDLVSSKTGSCIYNELLLMLFPYQQMLVISVLNISYLSIISSHRNDIKKVITAYLIYWSNYATQNLRVSFKMHDFTWTCYKKLLILINNMYTYIHRDTHRVFVIVLQGSPLCYFSYCSSLTY